MIVVDRNIGHVGSELPLPDGERAGVRGPRTLDRAKPLTRRAAYADLSLWER